MLLVPGYSSELTPEARPLKKTNKPLNLEGLLSYTWIPGISLI